MKPIDRAIVLAKTLVDINPKSVTAQNLARELEIVKTQVIELPTLPQQFQAGDMVIISEDELFYGGYKAIVDCSYAQNYPNNATRAEYFDQYSLMVLDENGEEVINTLAWIDADSLTKCDSVTRVQGMKLTYDFIVKMAYESIAQCE